MSSFSGTCDRAPVYSPTFLQITLISSAQEKRIFPIRSRKTFQSLSLRPANSCVNLSCVKSHVVDQINHPYVTDEILRSGRLYRSIILIRDPEPTIKSTMNMLKCREQEALDVYIKRLDELTKCGALLGERAILVQYDDLVDRTEGTLATLTHFLALQSPLTPTYASSSHDRTGRRVWRSVEQHQGRSDHPHCKSWNCNKQ